MDADQVMHELSMFRRDNDREISHLKQEIQDLREQVYWLRNAPSHDAAD